MNKIQLFIENHEIELNSSVAFAITRQFEDISNPTTLINTWSKSVDIPFTDRNNKIFGHIYCPDKVVVDGDASADKVGVYFNPYLKLDMRLIYNGMPIMTGYAKMTEVSRKDGNGSYKITLNGTLGKVLQEMKKITFDYNEYEDATDRDKYYIDGSKYVDSHINKILVNKCFNSTGQNRTDIPDIYRYVINPETGVVTRFPNPSYDITNVIGFAPCNAMDDAFDYKTFQTGISESKTFATVIDERYANENYDAKIEGDSLIPDGMMPREIGEYRSYLQLPFIYFNKLFYIFRQKAEAVTGYTFNLDDDWFSTSNPYWYKLVFMLNKLKAESGNTFNNGYNFNGENEIAWSSVNSTNNYETDRYIDITPDESTSTESTNRMNFTDGVIEIKDTDLDVCDGLTVNLNMYGSIAGSTSTVYLNKDNCLCVNVDFCKEDDTVVESKLGVFYRSDTDNESIIDLVNHAHCSYGISAASTSIKTGKPQGWKIPLNYTGYGANEYIYGNSMKVRVHAYWLNTNNPVGGGTAPTSITVESTGVAMSLKINEGNKRSNSRFILNDLWNNDYNLYDCIINYCKAFRISIEVDDETKTINFVPMNKYFENYDIVDWSNKVDMSKDFVVKPITFEHKYVMFDYKDNETGIGKKYLDKFGMDFGEKKIITEYNFNTDTTELFDGAHNAPIMNTDNILSWANIYYGNIKYSFPAETSVYCKDDSKKYVDNFGAYYFHCGRKAWDTEEALNLRNVYISDDTLYQIGYEVYCYNQNDSDMQRSNYYTNLDIVYGDNLCTFGIPAECYTYQNNYSGKKSVYYNMWKHYIDERYSIQNKIVTCYVSLSPIDYYKFKFNHFVKVDNQLYIVNKIYDYDMTSMEPTKVDLITVQSIEGYTDNNYE